MKIGKLIRKTPKGSWWFTLMWTQEQSNKDGSFLLSRFCFDSQEFNSYKKCCEMAIRHKKTIIEKEGKI